MENRERIKRILRQNRNGIAIERIAKKVGLHRSTVYRHLEHLSLTQEASFSRGIVYPGNEKTNFRSNTSERILRWFEKKDRKKIEQRIAKLAGLRVYYKERVEVDGIKSLEVALKMIDEEIRLLRKHLKQIGYSNH